jgi:hypothetical protein
MPISAVCARPKKSAPMEDIMTDDLSIPAFLLRPYDPATRPRITVRQKCGMSTKLVIAGLVATIALTMLGFWLAGEEASRGRCAGILHEDETTYWLGGEKGESTCLLARSEMLKVVKLCGVGNYCVVVGRTEDCEYYSGECVKISKVISVTMRKPPGQP